jgi:hypothetical protein
MFRSMVFAACGILWLSGLSLAADGEEKTPAVVKPVAVSASAHESKAAGGFADFPPEKTVDGDLAAASSWRAEIKDPAEGQWIQYDLGAETRVGGVRLVFVKGDERVYRFAIELSVDGENWTTTISTSSSGKDKSFESFRFDPAPARYVRIRGFGNSSEQFPHWINIVETQILSHP